jgi:hypothetical protein
LEVEALCRESDAGLFYNLLLSECICQAWLVFKK